MNTHTETASAGQALARLVKALQRPGIFPHPVGDIEVIETHISVLLLTGDYAYKLKKPLDLGFLDFSTLEKRRRCCEEELRLNRRLAPQLYLDVIGIGGDAEAPVIGAWPAIEYAVRMRQFPQQALYGEIQARGELGNEHVDRAATVLARFHRGAETATAEQRYGEPEQVMQPVRENFDQLRASLHGDEAGLLQDLASVERWNREGFPRLAPLITERKARGFVRECHGDAHLDNMVWLNGDCVFFDAIEFNPALRWIDVISEAAFLYMDLEARGCHALAARFLDAYLGESGDYAGCALLPFYLCYRAMVRAKVAAIRRAQQRPGSRNRRLDDVSLATHLRLARNYTKTRSPMLILTVGVSGSGKSHYTQTLLEGLGAIRLRSDVERKRLFGIAAGARTGAGIDQGIYSREASERTYRALLEQAGGLLRAGFTTIVDATFLKAAHRRPFERLARGLGLPCVLLGFQAPVAVLKQRIRARQEEGRDASEADIDVLEAQLAMFEAPAGPERPYLIEVGHPEMDIGTCLSRLREFQ